MAEDRFLSALIDRGPFGACVINIMPKSNDFGRILYFNPQFPKMLENSPEAIKNSFIWDYQLNASEIMLRDCLTKMATENEFESSICAPFQLKSGATIYFKLHLQPDEMHGKYKHPIELLIFFEKLEIENTEYDDFIIKHRQLEHMIIHLRDVISKLDSIISSLGHELQNYIGGIVMLGNILTQEIQCCKDSIHSYLIKDDKEKRTNCMDFAYHTSDRIINISELFNNIRNSSKKAYNLLSDLTLYKSLKTGKRKMQLTYVDIEELINDVGKIERPKFIQKDVTLICNFPEESVAFKADTQALTDVLLNLVSNARKFTRKNGKVSITGKLMPDSVVFEVKDNGIGIKSSRITELFDVSIPSSTHGTDGEEGTGLGLPICHEIIASHSGELLLETEENKGVKFIVKIPQPTKLSESQTDE